MLAHLVKRAAPAAILVLSVAVYGETPPQAPPYDLVIANGRMMDPESRLDAVRHIGIRGGTIVIVSATPLAGTRVIDATNHVVAPGFIDLHEHGQTEESYAMMVRDGVTSAFELEVGTGDVAAWYAARQAGQIVNHGVAVGHIPARMKVLGDPGTGLLPAGIGGSGSANDQQMAAMESDPARGPRAGRGGDGVRQRLHARRAHRRERCGGLPVRRLRDKRRESRRRLHSQGRPPKSRRPLS